MKLPTQSELKAFEAYQKSVRLKWLLAFAEVDIETKKVLKNENRRRIFEQDHI